MASGPIPSTGFSQLTVPQMKAEPQGGGAPFPSKLRKKELLDLLMANRHSPVDPQKTKTQPKQSKSNPSKSKAKQWRSDEPARRLLCFELKEGNLPLDPNEMGPAAIYCKCHESPEFASIECDDMFIQRLKSLREHVMKEEPLLKWNECHPARALLFEELEEGRIPLDADGMGPAQVWCNCCDAPQFKMRGMKFNDAFKRRLAALRKLVARDKSGADNDLEDSLKALKDHPPPTHNHRGEPQWNGSRAQKLLKEAVDRGDHMKVEPQELWRSNPKFLEFALNTFRWHIHQEVKTRKHPHTLKHDAEQKLRKHLGEMSTKEKE